MIPAFQGFLFGGGVNPFMSRVATYYLRDHLTEHVKRLIDIYRAKRDGMLRGLDETLAGTDAVISRPEGGFFVWIRLPSGTDPKRLKSWRSRRARSSRRGPRSSRRAAATSTSDWRSATSRRRSATRGPGSSAGRLSPPRRADHGGRRAARPQRATPANLVPHTPRSPAGAGRRPGHAGIGGQPHEVSALESTLAQVAIAGQPRRRRCGRARVTACRRRDASAASRSPRPRQRRRARAPPQGAPACARDAGERPPDARGQSLASRALASRAPGAHPVEAAQAREARARRR